jgi:rare lipoprotein A
LRFSAFLKVNGIHTGEFVLRLTRAVSLFVFAVACTLAAPSRAAQSPRSTVAESPRSKVALPARISPSVKQNPDLSGRARVGVASFYADDFFGKPMANGEPMNPRGNNAASRTLPLGTVAKVTNLETGKSAVVTIQDRGPYVKGRIVDLSPTTARKIGITPRKGLSKVVVAPVAVPLPDGSVKPGIAARVPEPRKLPLPVREARESIASTDRR